MQIYSAPCPLSKHSLFLIAGAYHPCFSSCLPTNWELLDFPAYSSIKMTSFDLPSITTLHGNTFFVPLIRLPYVHIGWVGSGSTTLWACALPLQASAKRTVVPRSAKCTLRLSRDALGLLLLVGNWLPIGFVLSVVLPMLGSTSSSRYPRSSSRASGVVKVAEVTGTDRLCPFSPAGVGFARYAVFA